MLWGDSNCVTYKCRQAITKHVLAKYPDLDGEKKRVYLRRAISAGLESEVLELGKNKGDHNSTGRHQEFFFQFRSKRGGLAQYKRVLSNYKNKGDHNSTGRH